MLKRLSVLVTALVTAGLVLASPASAYVPREEATFNDLTRTFSSRWALMDHVQATIDAVPREGEILISTYLLDRRVIVDRLIAASRNRAVSVRVILDEDIFSDQATRLENALNADNPPGTTVTTEESTWGVDRSYAKRCVGSCRGRGGNMHSKFYAFSQAGTAKNIVMVSSANLNAGGAMAGYNDLFTMTEQPGTYATYQQVHREMTQDSPIDDFYFTDPDGIFESRFFPMRDATIDTDPVMKDLEKVSCTGADTRSGKTSIHVSMFYWDGERGQWIRDRLLELAEQGCEVSIVYGAPAAIIAPRLKNFAMDGIITLFDSRVHTDDDGVVDQRVHSKYMIIRGNYNGDTSAKQVFTGSQNWVGGSLTRSDEVLLSIKSDAAYAQYLQNWKDVTRVGARQICETCS